MTHRDTNVAHGGTTAPRTGGQQTDEGNRQQGGQPGDDQRGQRRGVQPDDHGNRLDVTG